MLVHKFSEVFKSPFLGFYSFIYHFSLYQVFFVLVKISNFFFLNIRGSSDYACKEQKQMTLKIR